MLSVRRERHWANSIRKAVPHTNGSPFSSRSLIVWYTHLDGELIEIEKETVKEALPSASEAGLRSRAVSLLCRRLLEGLVGSPMAHREDGAPFLTGHPAPYISISHCGDIAALSAACVPHGVDVERLRPMPVNVLNRFYTENERKLVLSHTDGGEGSDRLFFSIWTRKEALIKSSAFTLGDVARIETCPDGELGDVLLLDRGEAFLTTREYNGNIISVCARRQNIPVVFHDLTPSEQRGLLGRLK